MKPKNKVTIKGIDGAEDFVAKSETLVGADFCGEILGNLDFSGLDLRGTNFSETRIIRCNFSHSCLDGSYFDKAEIMGSDFTSASISRASLYKCSVMKSDFSGTDLSETECSGSQFTSTNLEQCNFAECDLFTANFTFCDTLGLAKGLDAANPYGVSLDNLTLRSGIDDLPDPFLQGAGYTLHEIEYLRSLFKGSPIKYYSCFISHAEVDILFAECLLASLRKSNVTCWHYKENLRAGRDWQGQIDEAIKVYDKLILVCSRSSIFRPNVVKEIQKAIQQEDYDGTQRLFPIMLDDYILTEDIMERAREAVRSGQWTENWVQHIRKKHIADFRGWNGKSDGYSKSFNRLLSDLNLSNK